MSILQLSEEQSEFIKSLNNCSDVVYLTRLHDYVNEYLLGDKNIAGRKSLNLVLNISKEEVEKDFPQYYSYIKYLTESLIMLINENSKLMNSSDIYSGEKLEHIIFLQECENISYLLSAYRTTEIEISNLLSEAFIKHDEVNYKIYIKELIFRQLETLVSEKEKCKVNDLDTDKKESQTPQISDVHEILKTVAINFYKWCNEKKHVYEQGFACKRVIAQPNGQYSLIADDRGEYITVNDSELYDHYVKSTLTKEEVW